MRHQELLGQGLGDVALVAEELAEEATDQAGNGTAVVDVAGGEAEGEQLAAVIDDQVELEAVEPADRGLATPRVDAEDAMLLDTCRMADGEGGRVDEADARALAELGVQVDGERYQYARHELDETGVAHEPGKLWLANGPGRAGCRTP